MRGLALDTGKSAAGSVRTTLSGVLAPLAFLLVMVAALAALERDRGFLTADNWANIAQSTAVVAILAVGETAVIILGQIDLAVGRVLALSAVIAAWAMVSRGAGMWSGIALACAAGAACGLISGLLTTLGRMPAFIATLGMMGVANGLALRIAGDQNITGSAPGFDALSLGHLRVPVIGTGIPMPLVLMLAAALAMHVLLARTTLGRRIYAIGGNRDAARLSGISVARTTVAVFAISGLLCGFAAAIHVSRTGGAQPTAGAGMELQAIAATVIGGTSLSGGAGGVAGTLIGAFLMAVIQNGCDLYGAQPHVQLVIIGCVIWLAAMYDGARRGKVGSA